MIGLDRDLRSWIYDSLHLVPRDVLIMGRLRLRVLAELLPSSIDDTWTIKVKELRVGPCFVMYGNNMPILWPGLSDFCCEQHFSLQAMTCWIIVQ